MPSGFKTCKCCGNTKVFSLVQKCSCGFKFYKKRRAKGEKVKRIPNEKFRRLKNFVTRSFLDTKFSEEELSREVHVAKIMVNICYSDYDFLAKYKVPSWVKGENIDYKKRKSLRDFLDE